METMSIKEFYESFSELDGPNETAIQNNSTIRYKTFPKYKQRDLLTNEHNIKELGTISCNLEDTSFVSARQPTSHQVLGIEHQNITNKSTFKENNYRLEDVYKNIDNTKYLPHGQSTTSTENVLLKNAQPLSSKTFTNHGYRQGKLSCNLENTNLPHCELRDNIYIFTQQNDGTGSQSPSGKGKNYYDQLEDFINNVKNTNTLPPCQASTSRQAPASQHVPLSNISINIGNTINNQSTGNQIFSKPYLGKPEYREKYYEGNQSFQDTKNNINNNISLNKDSYIRKSVSLPKTILHHYKCGPSYMENNHYITTEHNQETINLYEPMIDISKTINNIPFKQFTSINGHPEKTLTNPSININNIKSINVHVHHPSEFSSFPVSHNKQSPSVLMDQRVPLVPSTYMLENNYPDMLQNGPNSISFSTNLNDDNSAGPNSISFSTNLNDDNSAHCSTTIPMESNSSEVNRYSGLTKSIIRDDIYLPTSEESCPSPDLDDWLNTIQITPLEPFPELSSEVYVVPESMQQVKKGVLNKSAIKKQKKRARSKISKDALEILKRWYEKDSYPSHDQQQIIADQTGHSLNTVKIWFQNRRQILKRCHMGTLYKKNKGITENKAEQNLETQVNYSVSEYPTLFSPQINSSIIHHNDNDLLHRCENECFI